MFFGKVKVSEESVSHCQADCDVFIFVSKFFLPIGGNKRAPLDLLWLIFCKKCGYWVLADGILGKLVSRL